MRTPRKLLSLFGLALGLTFLSLSAAFAQGSGTSTPAIEKKPIPAGFEPIAGKEEKAESVSAPLLVVLAYGTFFFLTFGYVVHIARRQKALSDEIEGLSRKIGRDGDNK